MIRRGDGHVLAGPRVRVGDAGRNLVSDHEVPVREGEAALRPSCRAGRELGRRLAQEVHRPEHGGPDRVVPGLVVLDLGLRAVIDVDRAGSRTLARRVRHRHVGVEDEAELDDREEDEQQRPEDEGELDEALATRGAAGVVGGD